MAADARRSSPKTDLAVLAALLVPFLAFVALTWARWPLVTADSARELYVPFHVRHGATIYRDFIYMYGPVAPYLSAGLLAAFGERLEVLYLASALQVAAITGLLYAAARHVLPAVPAGFVGFLFLTHFVPGQDIRGYMWPYSFAATWGVLFGLGVLVALLRHHATGRGAWLALAGALAGLSAVTKLEYGAAAAALVLAYLAGRLGFRRGLAATGPWWQEAALALAPLVAVAGAIATAVLAAVDLPTVLESVWPTRLMALWSSKGQWHGDLASWKENVRWFGVAAGTLALIAGHRRLWEALRRSWAARIGALAGLAALAAFAVGKPDRLPFIWEFGHRLWVGPSFVVLVGVVVAMGARLVAARRAGHLVPAEAVAWSLIAGYGLLVAARTVFRGYNDYTPYQAPVALIAWVALAACWLPAWLGTPTSRRATHALLVVLALGLGARHAADAAALYGRPQVAVSGPSGTLLAAEGFGRPFNAALAHVRGALRPGEAVVAGPMEASFYLFLGRDNPVREDQFFFGYLSTPAEQADFIERLRAADVRFFVLSSFGHAGKWFGVDYAQDLGRWLAGSCRRVAAYGEGPYRLTIYETPFTPNASPSSSPARDTSPGAPGSPPPP